jgi:hypothetical protein
MNNESPSKPHSAKYRQVRLMRWLGYFIAILVNVVVLVVVNRFPGWQVLPFLTPDFTRVLWLFNLSVLATIVANAFFIIYDPEWFLSLCRTVLNTISLVFAIRLWGIFPFDFSRYSGFDWALLARVVIIFTIVGISIAILVEFIKFIIALIRQR